MNLRRLAWAVLVPALVTTASAQQPAPPNSARSVTLSLAEYNRLIDLVSSRTASGAVDVPDVVLNTLDWRVRADGNVAHGTLTVVGESFADGVHRVPLMPAATLTAASRQGQPLPMVTHDGSDTALVRGRGPFVLTLEWGTAVGASQGQGSFIVPIPAAGTAHATFDLPGDASDIRLTAGAINSRTIVDGRTIVEATLPAGGAVQVTWIARETSVAAAPAKDVRLLADVLSLVTIGDADLRLTSLVDLTVVQGEPATFTLDLPAGYELTTVSGNSLDHYENGNGSVVLTIRDPAARAHQFLVGLERAHGGGSLQLDTAFVSVRNAQRQRGQVGIESSGTLDLAAEPRGAMPRIDVRELHPVLLSLARQPLLAAFRYQQTAAATPVLALDIRRFADAGVVAAVADRAEATTLVTSEGRALTEVKLHVKNRAQPFMKVDLPSGASLISVDVAGATAKPVVGSDGTRVPLLRPGFRPAGGYEVSFVYLTSGAPFARKGAMEMALPRMDVPISLMEWEVFVPSRYTVKAIGGDVIDARLAAVADARQPAPVAAPIASAVLAEKVTVTADSPALDTQPSQNVINLQQRASGVLPVRIDVPRAGTSHRFAKPLVVDQQTTVTLQYKRK